MDILPKTTTTLGIYQNEVTIVAGSLFRDMVLLKDERLPRLEKVSCCHRYRWVGKPANGPISPLSGSLLAVQLSAAGIDIVQEMNQLLRLGLGNY